MFLLLENIFAKSRDEACEMVCLCACLGVCLPVSVCVCQMWELLPQPVTGVE